MNHYPRHVGDFIRATMGLSLAERGAYNALLDQYYANEAPLPLDAKERYRMVGAISKADRAAVDYVVRRYFTEQDDGWHNRRADAEIAMYQIRADKARENGAKGGRPPNRTETDSVNSANQEITGSKTNPEPVTSNQTKARSKTKAPPAALPGWLAAEDWERWRKHRGRKAEGEAGQLQIAKLDALRQQGHDPPAMISAAIESGWATFYPPRAPPRAINGSAAQGRAEVADFIFKRGKHGSGEQKPGAERDITGESERVA